MRPVIIVAILSASGVGCSDPGAKNPEVPPATRTSNAEPRPPEIVKALQDGSRRQSKGPDSPPLQASIVVAEETLGVAGDNKFDYAVVLALAERGDQSSIAKLMTFSAKTDAAASLGHGVVLIELLRTVGDSQFAEVLSSQSKKTKVLVGRLLEAGIAYSRDPQLQRSLLVQAPVTAKVIENTDVPEKE